MFHTKTDAGREEIRARQLKLSRSARTLLLILEPSKPTEEWMQMVRGSTQEDLQGLLALGLIAPRAGLDEPPVLEVDIELPAVAAAAPQAPSLETPVAPAVVADAEAPAAAGGNFADLTQRFTQLATRHLGLLESYRMVLEIERCTSVSELRALAPRLMAAVERNVGAEKAQRLRAEFGADLSAGPR